MITLGEAIRNWNVFYKPAQHIIVFLAKHNFIQFNGENWRPTELGFEYGLL